MTIRAGEVPRSGLVAWGEAVSDALVSYVPGDRGGAQLLQTYQDAAELLRGTAEPETSSEQGVVSDWDPANAVEVYIAAAHEDTSLGSVASYAADAENAMRDASVVWLVGPGDSSASCSIPCSTLQPGRLAAFQEASKVHRVNGWNGPGECPLFEPSPTCEPYRCTVETIPSNADGSTECRVFFAASDNEGCLAEEGWRELDDSLLSLEVQAAWPNRTVCELVQLRGTAMAACQSDLECAGCEPGFCLTQVPELTTNCVVMSREILPRTITPARVGQYEIYCPSR